VWRVSLLVLEEVSLSFADRVIVDSLGLRVGEHDRIGLVGPNGSGKTTLLRMVAGQQSCDKGSISPRRGMRLGYLPQELEVDGGRSLRDFVLSSVPGRMTLDQDLADTEAELAALDGSGDEAALLDCAERLAELHERLDHFDRFFSEHEAMRILAGLGFAPADKDRDMGEFSGGWRMRGVLAALLFQQPDLMLLDEPTNHLDMPSVAWFSDFLKRWRRAFVLISHDREFLNEQISRVVSFEPEGVRQYTGNFEQYVRQRAEEETILDNKAKNLARQREDMQRFIDRFRAQANKAKAVQSRIKLLDKMETVQTLEHRRSMRFSFPPCERAPSEVLRASDLAKAYGELVVFPGLDVALPRGEKIALIGANGAGKTTLLKMLAGELAPDHGTVRLGNGVTVGYYAQHHADTLHPSSTVYEEVSRANPDAGVSRVRALLGAFLFGGDDVDKKVSVLSGGERARVALARLLIKPGNLLLMDEPTNHLDLASAEALAESLAGYDGTLVFVSHNRSLIRTLATRIWNVEGGGVDTYNGTLDEYMYSCRLRLEQAGGDGDGVAASAGGPAGPVARAAEAAPDAAGGDRGPDRGSRDDDKARRRREAAERQRRAKALGPITSRIASLEDRIGELEAAQKARGVELSDPDVYADAARRNRLLGEFQDAAGKLDELTGRWEAAHEELAAAERKLDGDEGNPSR
jgi:ATP-binding cassette subfamily F protein 3